MTETTDAEEFATTIGMDAFRLAIGQKPQHFTVGKICKWLRGMARMERAREKRERPATAPRPAMSGKRLGGLARAEKLSPARRSEIARAAAIKRWNGHADG